MNLFPPSRLLVLLFLFSATVFSQPAAWIVVNNQGPDNSNRRPSIENQGQWINVGGVQVFDPPDDCVNPASPRYKQFKTLQSALYALSQGFLNDRKIVVATNGPLLGYDTTVPSGVPRTIIVGTSVEIIAGPSTTPVIQGGADVVTITARDVMLEGLEITAGSGAGVRASPGPMTTSMDVTLVDMYIHNNRGSGVSIDGGRVNLSIFKRNNRRVRIEDHSAYGVYMKSSRGRCSISDTDILRSGYDGMRIQDAAFLMEDCRVDSSGYRGISLERPQNSTIRYSQVTNNARGGVRIDSTTTFIARLTGNRITGNGLYGVHLLSGGANMVLDTISRTTGFGFWGERAVPVTFEDSFIDSSDSSGVLVFDSSRVSFVRTKVRENGNHGISSSRSTISAKRTTVFHSGENGIYSWNSSTLMLSDSCVIDTSGMRGISIRDNSTATIDSSVIKRNVEGGISVRNCPGQIRVRGNKILDNHSTSMGGGILVWERSNPTIIGNDIRGNEAEGIGGGISVFGAAAQIGGPVPADRNTVRNNLSRNGIGGGIAVREPTANVLIQGNAISKNRAPTVNALAGRGGGIAFSVSNNVSLRVVGNTIDSNVVSRFGGGIAAIEVRNGGLTVGGDGVERNLIRWNRAEGSDSLGTDSLMRVGGGMYVSRSDSGLIRNNAIHGNVGTGIHMDSCSAFRLERNLIGQTPGGAADPDSGHGISLVRSYDNSVGRENTIAHNVGSGVSVGNGGVGNRISRNSITNNALLGIDLWRRGNLEIPAPVLLAVSAANIRGWVPAAAGSTIEIYEDPDGEGATYRGTAAVRADSTFQFAGAFANNGLNVTTTVTDARGNTSEFGNALINIVFDLPVNRVIDMTDPTAGFLEIGHWGGDAGLGLTGYTAGGAVRNAAATAANAWNNFVDRDPDRFYIRVRDSRANVTGRVQDTVSVTFETRDSLGRIHDNATEIQLVETGPNTGIFASQSQLLMAPDLPAADNPDDNFTVHDGMTGPVADDTRNDRTHRASVNDTVLVRFVHPRGASAVSVTVPVCRRAPENRLVLTVQAYIFNEPWRDVGYDHDANPATVNIGAADRLFSFTDSNGNGMHDPGERCEMFIDISAGAAAFGIAGSHGPIWTNAQVTRTMTFMGSYLAPACIRIRELPRLSVNPTGMLFLHTTGFFDDYPDDVTGTTLSRDEAIIQAGFRSVANAVADDGNDVADIYFVAPLTVPGGAFASAIAPIVTAASGLPINRINQVHIGFNSQVRNVPFAPAHEVMHLLTNQGDVVTPRYVFFPAGGAVAGDGTTWNTRRRMTAATATTARTTPRAAVGGNNLLRTP